MSDKLIHLEWDGPYQWHGKGHSTVASLSKPTDIGVYQIYGGHATFTNNVLLYIGLAAKQSFAARIKQETHWLWNKDFRRVEVYVGRLAGSKNPPAREWIRRISLAERLLIFVHKPPFNSQMQLRNLKEALRSVHIFNWGSHRDLLPEVSGSRWSGRFDTIPNYRPFGLNREAWLKSLEG